MNCIKILLVVIKVNNNLLNFISFGPDGQQQVDIIGLINLLRKQKTASATNPVGTKGGRCYNLTGLTGL